MAKQLNEDAANIQQRFIEGALTRIEEDMRAYNDIHTAVQRTNKNPEFSNNLEVTEAISLHQAREGFSSLENTIDTERPLLPLDLQHRISIVKHQLSDLKLSLAAASSHHPISSPAPNSEASRSSSSLGTDSNNSDKNSTDKSVEEEELFSNLLRELAEKYALGNLIRMECAKLEGDQLKNPETAAIYNKNLLTLRPIAARMEEIIAYLREYLSDKELLQNKRALDRAGYVIQYAGYLTTEEHQNIAADIKKEWAQLDESAVGKNKDSILNRLFSSRPKDPARIYEQASFSDFSCKSSGQLAKEIELVCLALCKRINQTEKFTEKEFEKVLLKKIPNLKYEHSVLTTLSALFLEYTQFKKTQEESFRGSTNKTGVESLLEDHGFITLRLTNMLRTLDQSYMQKLLKAPFDIKPVFKTLTVRLERLKNSGAFEALTAHSSNIAVLRSLLNTYIQLAVKAKYSLEDVKRKGKNRDFLAYAKASFVLLSDKGEKEDKREKSPSPPSSPSSERAAMQPASPRSFSVSGSSNSDSPSGVSGRDNSGRELIDLSGYSSEGLIDSREAPDSPVSSDLKSKAERWGNESVFLGSSVFLTAPCPPHSPVRPPSPAGKPLPSVAEEFEPSGEEVSAPPPSLHRMGSLNILP